MQIGALEKNSKKPPQESSPSLFPFPVAVEGRVCKFDHVAEDPLEETTRVFLKEKDQF